jgi:RNA polymerase sigma factor (sigma-70 family)
MARGQIGVARQLQSLFAQGSFAGVPDRTLLERYLAVGGDGAEAAFAALVDRHGPMVLAVCRTILRDHQDAQDAFQATFLLLATKAQGLRDKRLLANWLYGVAMRSALKLRSRSARRRRHERRAAERSPEAVCPPEDDAEGHAALYEEIDALPERYRAPVVLCYLEGTSREMAADLLGCGVNTLGVRLMRARKRLKERLTARQLHLASGLVGFVFDGRPVSPSMARATVKAASAISSGRTAAVATIPHSILALVKEVQIAMLMTPMKMIAGILIAFGVITAGVAVVAHPPASIERSSGVERDEQDVLALERDWGDALVRRDAAAVDRIVAYEMTGVDPGGHLWDKRSYVDSVKAGFNIESYELADVKIRIYGDAAVVAGRTVLNKKSRSGFTPGGSIFTNMYVRRNGCWQCVAWQTVGAPAGETPAAKAPEQSGVSEPPIGPPREVR